MNPDFITDPRDHMRAIRSHTLKLIDYAQDLERRNDIQAEIIANVMVALSIAEIALRESKDLRAAMTKVREARQAWADADVSDPDDVGRTAVALTQAEDELQALVHS